MIFSALWRLLLQAVPVLFTVTLIVFALVFLAGDPTVMMIPDQASEADRLAMVAAWGLDQPVHLQYLNYMRNLLHGDFGTSYRYGSSALPIVLERLPATLLLAAASMLVAVLIAVPAGMAAALRRGHHADLGVWRQPALAAGIGQRYLGAPGDAGIDPGHRLCRGPGQAGAGQHA
jgi:peptide/nickel transport system permease protein